MSEGPADALHLCFGVHNHQPVGNFESVVAEAAERAYRPFLERVRGRPEIRITVHTTGNLLEWLREHASATFDLLGTLVSRGQAELLTGGFYEPVLAILPDHDKLGQIARLSDYLKQHFGVRPRGMWLAERVWEPHLPRALREAGVEYVLVDDSHFALAGLDPETIGGYYLTEEQGAVVAVFPISQRLRYLIPFADVDESVRYLAARRGHVDVLTVMDDGEKFGAWPGTYAHVYESGWLDRFFDRVLDASWIRLATFGEMLDRFPASGRVYLPTASYREMGEWALTPSAGRDLARAKCAIGALDDGARLETLLRGGFWRSFLVKYPEVADTYWKMLRLSETLHREIAARPDEPRLLDARTSLWRAQANDAYWHGVFGGCYLPHLRRAIKQSLLESERLVADVLGTPGASWMRGDLNGDGRDEISARTRELVVTVNPDLGGSITEIGWLPRALDVADVLTRRPELYHDRLRETLGGTTPTVSVSDDAPAEKEIGLVARIAYDGLRRASLLDGWFDSRGELDPVAPWDAARCRFGDVRLDATVREADGGVAIVMRTRTPSPVHVDKTVDIRGASVAAEYRIAALDGETLAGRWGVQWNLALTAGNASDRYFELDGRPALGSTGRVADRPSVSLVDEWAGVRLTLAWSPGAELSWGPVETVSVSEGGLERIYQGTAMLLTWPVAQAREARVSTTLTVGARS